MRMIQQLQTEAERIAVLESKFDNINTEMTGIRADLKALSMTIDKLFGVKITDHSKIESEIAIMREELRQLQKSSSLWKFLSPTMAAALGAILSFLVTQYLALHH